MHCFMGRCQWSLILGFVGVLLVSGTEVQWIVSELGESQYEACSRNQLKPVDMNKIPDINWNKTTLDHVVVEILNLQLAPEANRFGILGCCAPSLWCNASYCFTQNFAEHYSNFGPLSNGPSSYNPVYTCWNDSTGSVSNPVNISFYRISDEKLFLDGSNFGNSDVGLTVPLNSSRCRNAGLCDCTTCAAGPHTCPIGSTCAYSYTAGFSCFKICAGSGDESCPCDQVCRNAQNVFGEDMGLCVPRNLTALKQCHANGGSQLMCDLAPYAMTILPEVMETALDISLVVSYSGDQEMIAFQNLNSCSSDEDCFDGDICTTDSCIGGICSFNQTSCSSMLPAILEQYTPYTYSPLNFQASNTSSIYAFITSSSSKRTVQKASTSGTITMPFYMLFFGNLLNQFRIFGSSLIAFPPYPTCESTNVSILCDLLLRMIALTASIVCRIFHSFEFGVSMV